MLDAAIHHVHAVASWLSISRSFPPSLPSRFPSAQTRKSNSELTKRTFILSPLANCHLFADWNFLLLVGFRDKRSNKKKKKKNCASYNCNSYYFPCEWNPLPCEIILAEYCYSLENSRSFRHSRGRRGICTNNFLYETLRGRERVMLYFSVISKRCHAGGKLLYRCQPPQHPTLICITIVVSPLQSALAVVVRPALCRDSRSHSIERSGYQPTAKAITN